MLRATLRGWLDANKDPAQFESHFVKHRNALLRAKAKKGSKWVREGGNTPPLYYLDDVVEDMDSYMKQFAEPQNHQGGVAPKSAPIDTTALLGLVKEFRKNNDSIEPLLPYLLAVTQRNGTDPTVEFCLFLAWGTNALDGKAAHDAVQRLHQLLGEQRDYPSLHDLVLEQAVVSAGKLEPGTLLQALDSVCTTTVDQNRPIGPNAIGKAFLPILDHEFESAVRTGESKRVLELLRAMRVADPDEIAPLLIAEMAGQRLDGRFADAQARLQPEAKSATTARLTQLGLHQIAPSMSVEEVVRRIERRELAAFPMLSSEMEGRLSAAESRVSSSVSRAEGLREQARQCEERAGYLHPEKAYPSQRQGLQDEKDGLLRAAQRAKDDANTCDADAQRARGEVEQIRHQIEERARLRGSFRLK